MASLTCENHPDLVWSCKDMAISNGRYNGSRHIFFFGRRTERFSDGSGWNGTFLVKDEAGKVISYVQECSCSPSKLILIDEITGEICEEFLQKVRA